MKFPKVLEKDSNLSKSNKNIGDHNKILAIKSSVNA